MKTNKERIEKELEALKKKVKGKSKEEALLIVDEAIEDMEKEMKTLEKKLSPYYN